MRSTVLLVTCGLLSFTHAAADPVMQRAEQRCGSSASMQACRDLVSMGASHIIEACAMALDRDIPHNDPAKVGAQRICGPVLQRIRDQAKAQNAQARR